MNYYVLYLCKNNTNNVKTEHIGFGVRLIEVRKKRGFSLEELAGLLGTKKPGRYERRVAKPTFEVAGKLSKILGVSLDYLVGNSQQELDIKTQKLFLEVQTLPQEIKGKVLYFIDISIKDFKTRQAYGA